jgi:hypothetical protein
MRWQWAWGFWIRDTTWGYTAYFGESYVIAEVAMNSFGATQNIYTQAAFGISHVVSNGVAEFFPYGGWPNMVCRARATAVTFSGCAINAGAECRWFINGW